MKLHRTMITALMTGAMLFAPSITTNLSPLPQVVVAAPAKDVEGYFESGLSNYANEKYGDAIADFTRVISLEPHKSRGYFYRGICYRESGKLESAVADLSRAIEIDPKDANNYINRGETYYRLKDYDRAASDFNKVIALNPKHVPTAEELELAKMGITIDTDPHSVAWAHYGLGQIYFDTSDYNRALDEFTKAINDTKQSKFYRERAKCYARLGDKSKARADEKQADELAAAEDRALDDLDDQLNDLLEGLL